MAQQALEPVHQLQVLGHAAKRTDSLVGIQAPARERVSIRGGLLRLPDSIEQRFGYELGQDDIVIFGPVTAECGLFGRQCLDLLRPTIAIQPRLGSGVRKILGAVRGQPGEIHRQFGNSRSSEDAQNRVNHRHLS